MLTPAQETAVDQIAQASVKCEALTGYPAEITAAQCIFESAYLSRCPGNNCFGIKPDNHGSGTQYVLTREFLNGEWEKMPLAFESYGDIADCFADHARLLQSGIYAPGWLVYQQDKDLDKLFQSVAVHYATDPNYYRNIDAEIHSSTVTNALKVARGN
jgi:flagellum-specific peptidoglycan hydrolase FlgJ